MSAPVWRARRARRRRQQGQVLVLMALVFTVLVAVAGLIVQLGEGQLHKRLAQNAADAAALAAAYSLWSGNTSESVATAKANKVITVEGFSSASLIVYYYDSAGATDSNGATVATVKAKITDSTITDQFDWGQSITAVATADANTGVPQNAGYTYTSPCALCTLETGSAYGFSIDTHNMTLLTSSGNWDVDSNASIQANNFTGTLNGGGKFNVTGTVNAVGTISTTPPWVTGVTAISDPFASFPLPVVSTQYGAYSLNTNNNNVTLDPGIYNGITITGNNYTVTFNPGTYVLTGPISLTANSLNINGTGVTFYMTCNGYNSNQTSPCAVGQAGAYWSVAGNSATWNLTAPQSVSNPMRNMLMYFDRNNTSGFTYSGNSSGTGTLVGVIYAASGTVAITSNKNNFGITGMIDSFALDLAGNNITLNVAAGAGQAPAGSPPWLTP